MEWLHIVEKALPDQIGINWRYFSLHQVNYKGADTWQIWNQPLGDPDWTERDYMPSLRSFWGAEAARRQGEDAFRRFHQALLRSRHQLDQSLARHETVLSAAERAELDMVQFRAALVDPTCLERLAADHTRAVDMGIFGTPTFAFPDAVPAYLKLSQLPEPEDALAFWQEFYRIVAGRPFVLEIKRPH
jgi:hypothetical protein